MFTLEGISSVANFITAYKECQLNRNSHFLIRSLFFVSKGNRFAVKFTKHIVIINILNFYDVICLHGVCIFCVP